ncbi:MAG: penicillin acylase family protein [Terriglobales bacterium]
MRSSTSLEAPRRRRGRWVNWLLDAALIVLALFVVVCGYGYWQAWRTEPRRDGTLFAAGLAAPAAIVRDSRGIAHITAANLHDLYFAEGFAMAQDRLWQMDLLRRIGEGTLAEIAGPAALPLDEQARTLGLYRVAQREAAALEPADGEILAALSAGVNRFIAGRRGRLPLEFRLLHYQPQPWRPVDSLAIAAQMYRSLSMSYKDELEREAFLAAAGPRVADAVFPDRSPWDIPPGSWPAPAAGAGPRLAAAPRAGSGEIAPALLATLAAAPASTANRGAGSNNWVLAAARTTTGAPILANDPHLEYQQPGIWWAAELRAPQLHVIGVTFPGIPGVVIGHNDHIAWGMTNVGADVQDLYREPAGAGQSQVETIRVKGWAPVAWTVRSTPRGPIVAQNGAAALALDWSLYHPGSLRGEVGMFQRLDQAADWRDFEAALADFPGPAQNFVYADTAGNIGYQCAGRIPLRARGDGSLPVPGGDPSYRWTGWIPAARLPRVLDPASGLLVTANGRIAPDGYPYLITHHWDAPYRTRRIYQLLAAQPRWRPGEMSEVQTDTVSLLELFFARQAVAAAERRPDLAARLPAAARQALGLLRGFDGDMRRDKVAPTIANRLRHEFLRRVLAAKVGDALAEQYAWSESGIFEQALLAARPDDWLPRGERGGWDGFLLDCLRRVAASTPLAPSRGRWGLHEILEIKHPVYSRVPLLSAYADLGPVEIDGDHFTVKQTTHVLGPSMRFVADLSDWDRSTLTLTAGENGEPFGGHYRDEFVAYLRGQALPLWYSPAAVAAHAAHRLVLQPAGGGR